MKPRPRTRYSTRLTSRVRAPTSEVGAAHGVHHLGQRQAVGLQQQRVHVHLVLADEAADGGHLGHAVRGLQGAAHGELLERAQLLGVEAADHSPVRGDALQGVPEDLAEARGVRAELRGGVRRQQVLGQA